jgi:hypothetical protein
MHWLDLMSVCRLDSALCHTEQRAHFIESSQDQAAVFVLIPRIQSWEYIEWLVRRKFKIKSVNFPLNLCNLTLCRDLLVLNNKTLARCDFQNCFWARCDIMHWLPKQLKSVHMINCKSIDDEALRALSLQCREFDSFLTKVLFKHNSINYLDQQELVVKKLSRLKKLNNKEV